ncbi:MAG: ABC transporter permease [Chloroflexota bacterium]|nr:MAG: ABC transporter permease [Chloroflexota bacterium]
MKIWVFSAYLIKDLRHDIGRSLLTIAGLSIMIVSYLLTSALSEAFDRFGQQPGIASHNLLILSADTIDPMQGSVSQAALDLAVRAVQEKFGPQSIRRVEPTIFRTLRISTNTVEVIAVAPQAMTEVFNLALLEGRYPTGSTEIAASQEAFAASGWQVGQIIEFYGQAFQLVGKVRYDPGKMASLWMTYAAAEQLFGSRRGFQIGALQIAGELDPEMVRAYLETVPGILPSYAVYLEQEVHARYAQAVRDILTFTMIMDLLALGVISFGIFNATSLTLAERSRELVLLRVVGFSPGAIGRFLFGRALLQTLAAYGLGWGLAALAIRQNAAASFSMHGIQVKLSLSPANLLLGLALTVVFAWFGVWLITFSQGRKNLASLLRD